MSDTPIFYETTSVDCGVAEADETIRQMQAGELLDGDPWEVLGTEPVADTPHWVSVKCRRVCHHKHPLNMIGNIAYLEDIDQFLLELKVECPLCSAPFRFIGFPTGCMLDQPAVNPDATELRMPIAPGARDVPTSGTAHYSLRQEVM